MARIRKIYRSLSEGRNYFIIDACFLANKYIPPSCAPDDKQRVRIEKCMEWWEEIDEQLNSSKARIYIPDICIAEAYKVLAHKYYRDKWFERDEYRRAIRKLASETTTRAEELRKFNRRIKYHDISTSRDLIISVDRFFRVFLKEGLNVQLPDLIILATAKYIMDFYDVPRKRLHIVTLDRNLRKGAKMIQELPYVYDPTLPKDERHRVFMD